MKSITDRLFLLCMCISIAACQNDDISDARFDGVEYNPTPFNLEVPDGFPELSIPIDNPMTIEGVELGRMLYYDPILHRNGDQACANCHQQENAFSSMATVLPHINLGWNTSFLWNGKVQGGLEDIMLFEVRDFFQADLDRLNAHDDYPVLFYQAFGKKEITYDLSAKALAQFERTMISGNSTYDKVMRGERFFTDEELNGYEIFFTERGDCFHCHGGILFTDNLFHNNGLDAEPATGRMEITGAMEDLGKFKSPTLRNIALTGPYMHDGRYATLEEVIDFYSEGLVNSETIDPLMKQIQHGGIRLTSREKSDLIAFLLSLTDEDYVTNPELGNPF